MKDLEIIFEYINISASERLEQKIRDHVSIIKERYSFITRVHVFLKLDNKDHGSKHHCGIRLSVPGPRLYASSNEVDFEKAINETIRDLKDILEKRKAKMASY